MNNFQSYVDIFNAQKIYCNKDYVLLISLNKFLIYYDFIRLWLIYLYNVKIKYYFSVSLIVHDCITYITPLNQRMPVKINTIVKGELWIYILIKKRHEDLVQKTNETLGRLSEFLCEDINIDSFLAFHIPRWLE